MIEMVFSYKLFNPLFWHIREAMHDKDIRYIINRGGSSSGKSVSTTQAVLLSVLSGDGSALIVRKVGASLKNTVYEEFKTQMRVLQLSRFFSPKENNITCMNGCKIDFTGLDDPEKIKSITGYSRCTYSRQMLHIRSNTVCSLIYQIKRICFRHN